MAILFSRPSVHRDLEWPPTFALARRYSVSRKDRVALVRRSLKEPFEHVSKSFLGRITESSRWSWHYFTMANSRKKDSDLLKVSYVARRTGLSHSTVQRLMRKGVGDKIGGDWYTTRARVHVRYPELSCLL